MVPLGTHGRGAATIRPSGFFVLRTPLLPLDVLRRWTSGIPGTTWDDDAVVLEARLRELVRQPAIREALFLASPSLEHAIQAWLADAESPRARGVMPIVVRYLVRMAARSTPFGLFSGCSTGRVAETTALCLADISEYSRHTRLDTHYVASLASSFLEDDRAWQCIHYWPNSSLIEKGSQLRYIEAHIAPGTRERTYRLVTVERSRHLTTALERALRGASSLDLARSLVDEEVSLDAALTYVKELIDAQILESELVPAMTGREPLDELVETLTARLPESAEARVLSVVREKLHALDTEPIGLPIRRYEAIADDLSTLATRPDPARLFQVDLYKPTSELTLGRPVLEELEAAVSVLGRIAAGSESPELRRFREAFIQRYELAEVPLLEALDEELGVGFPLDERSSVDPSPLLRDLHLPDFPETFAVDAGARGELLMWRASEALRRGEWEWSLSPADLKTLERSESAVLPDAFAIFGTLAARSVEAVDRGDFRFHLRGVAGPSGARLLGRFCHGDDALRAAVEAHLREEEHLRPEAIFAEVVHLPEGRLGNVLCRPTLRAFEIPYLGRSGAPGECQIPVQDLRVSVRGHRIVLRSASRDREVIPRLTSAHNYSTSELSVYRFLCSLQDSRPLAWSWGSAAGALPFLPRVSVGRTVLSLARWCLREGELKALDVGSRAARQQAIRELRDRLKLPRWVSVADADNVLPVDLENVLSVDSFVGLVKGRASAVLLETFPEYDDLVVTSDQGRFAHELVVPFVSTRSPAPAARVSASPSIQRAFAPGSQWLYTKVYTGHATADQILREVMGPLRNRVMASGDADAWFFLRYADPAPHLRVRFRGDPARLLEAVLPALHTALAPWLADGRVAKLQLDTYVREIERYGGDPGIRCAEDLFHADSEAALELCNMLVGDRGADLRWRLALYGMHALLVDLGFDLEERLELVARQRLSFASEHRANSKVARQVGKRFREERKSLNALLVREATELTGAYQVYDRRSLAVRPLASELRALTAAGKLTSTMADLASSFLHMHVNRLLRSEQRTQEWLLYEFLKRLYESMLARRS